MNIENQTNARNDVSKPYEAPALVILASVQETQFNSGTGADGGTVLINHS